MRTLRRNIGFSMLEMMIALLILSIGLIGVASLQARGQQFNHSAYVRTQAAFLAYDIMDRMRASDDNIPNNGNDEAYEIAEGECPTEENTTCDLNPCSHSEIVAYDISNWCRSLSSSLPLGTGYIIWNENSRLYTIVISWTEDRTEDAKIKQQSWNIAL